VPYDMQAYSTPLKHISLFTVGYCTYNTDHTGQTTLTLQLHYTGA